MTTNPYERIRKMKAAAGDVASQEALKKPSAEEEMASIRQDVQVLMDALAEAAKRKDPEGVKRAVLKILKKAEMVTHKRVFFEAVAMAAATAAVKEQKGKKDT